MFTSDSNLCWKSLQNGSFMTTPNNTILIRAFIVFYLFYQVRYWLHNTGFIFKERISLEELEAALRLSIMSSSLWHDWDHLAGFMAEIPASTARCWRETRATRDSEPRDSDKSSSAISGNNRNEKIKQDQKDLLNLPLCKVMNCYINCSHCEGQNLNSSLVVLPQLA